MEFVGKWACVDHLDTQLNVMTDGDVYVTYSELGEYGIKVDAHVSGGTLEWEARGYSWRLSYSESGVLTGTCTSEDGTQSVTFIKTPDDPESSLYHHAPQGEAVALPATFQMGMSELVGRWWSNVPYNNMEMNIREQDGDVSVLLALEGIAFTPVSVWFEGDALVWQINDSYNRGVCVISPKGGELVGTYRQIHKDAFPPVRFVKLSDVPNGIDDYKSLSLPDKKRLDILKEYAAYERGNEKVETEYVLGGELPSVLEEYGFDDYIKGTTGDDVAFACLDFVCDHFHHYGNSGMPRSRSLVSLIDWCRGHDGTTNCRGLSIILGNLLRYCGIRAQHVTCQPYEDPFNDCHVVVDCYLPSGARVMLDPTYRLYFKDADGKYVSLPRLREILVADGELFSNESASYTGGEGFDLSDYREYMAKNTLRFSKDRVNVDGRDESEQMWLFPIGYPSDKVCMQADAIVLFDDSAFWGE